MDSATSSRVAQKGPLTRVASHDRCGHSCRYLIVLAAKRASWTVRGAGSAIGVLPAGRHCCKATGRLGGEHRRLPPRPGEHVERRDATARPLVYVPKSQSNSVDVIDPTTCRSVEHFSVGYLPQHVVPAWNLRTLYVTNDAGKQPDADRSENRQARSADPCPTTRTPCPSPLTAATRSSSPSASTASTSATRTVVGELVQMRVRDLRGDMGIVGADASFLSAARRSARCSMPRSILRSMISDPGRSETFRLCRRRAGER